MANDAKLNAVSVPKTGTATSDKAAGAGERTYGLREDHDLGGTTDIGAVRKIGVEFTNRVIAQLAMRTDAELKRYTEKDSWAFGCSGIPLHLGLKDTDGIDHIYSMGGRNRDHDSFESHAMTQVPLPGYWQQSSGPLDAAFGSGRGMPRALGMKPVRILAPFDGVSLVDPMPVPAFNSRQQFLDEMRRLIQGRVDDFLDRVVENERTVKVQGFFASLPLPF